MRRLALGGALAGLFASVASAAVPKAYILKHPAHERCKPHYARQVKSVHTHGKTVRQVWCAYKLTRTSTAVVATEAGGLLFGQPRYYAVSASVWPSAHVGGGRQLIGLPVTYTITDATTGRAIGSFSGLSNLHAACAVVTTYENGRYTFTGRAVPPDAACALGRVTAPGGDYTVLGGSFAGNATYAPSVSPTVPFAATS